MPRTAENPTQLSGGHRQRHPSKIKAWQAKYQIPEKNCYNYDTFDQIADNPDIDVVYIVLPNGMHAEYTIRAAKAGKHVLCEKPMANTASDCMAMIEACRDAGKELAIGYRCQFEPHHQTCMQLARDKTFGNLKVIDAGFGFKIEDPNQWRLKADLAGGGALMDVGIYALQACRYLAGEEPIEISAQETKTDPVKFAEVDESIVWTMKFPSGVLAYCGATYAFSGINRFHAHCDKGWFPSILPTATEGSKVKPAREKPSSILKSINLLRRWMISHKAYSRQTFQSLRGGGLEGPEGHRGHLCLHPFRRSHQALEIRHLTSGLRRWRRQELTRKRFAGLIVADGRSSKGSRFL